MPILDTASAPERKCRPNGKSSSAQASSLPSRAEDDRGERRDRKLMTRRQPPARRPRARAQPRKSATAALRMRHRKGGERQRGREPEGPQPLRDHERSSGTTEATPTRRPSPARRVTGAPSRWGARPSSKIASADSKMSGWRPIAPRHSAASARVMRARPGRRSARRLLPRDRGSAALAIQLALVELALRADDRNVPIDIRGTPAIAETAPPRARRGTDAAAASPAITDVETRPSASEHLTMEASRSMRLGFRLELNIWARPSIAGHGAAVTPPRRTRLARRAGAARGRRTPAPGDGAGARVEGRQRVATCRGGGARARAPPERAPVRTPSSSASPSIARSGDVVSCISPVAAGDEVSRA